MIQKVVTLKLQIAFQLSTEKQTIPKFSSLKHNVLFAQDLDIWARLLGDAVTLLHIALLRVTKHLEGWLRLLCLR